MEKHTGIIIKKHIQSHKFVLIDSALGKIVGFVAHRKLHPGTLLMYTLNQRNNVVFIENIDIDVVPCAMAQDDILFLHHMLEICYYVLPVGVCARDVIILLQELYKKEEKLSWIYKKATIFKLMSILGLYPENNTTKKLLFHRLTTESIDTIAQTIIDLSIEPELTKWIHSCILVHPHAKFFKTLSLYNRDH